MSDDEINLLTEVDFKAFMTLPLEHASFDADYHEIEEFDRLEGFL
jgi:hypothetical protein